MLKHSTRRWLAGLGVAGAIIAASATPAAAEPAAEFKLYFQDTTVAVGSHGVDRSAQLFSSETTVLHDVTVSYDYRGLVGKVRMGGSRDGYCNEQEPGLMVCDEPIEVAVDAYYPAGLTDVYVAPTDKAKADDEGEVKVSVKAGGKDVAAYTSRIRVGEGVDLAGGPRSELDVKVGASFQAPLTVVNVGETTAKGVVAFFDNNYAIRAEDRFSNCLYADEFLIACEFDEEIPGGEGRTTTLNYRLGDDTYAPSRQYGSTWFMTPADFEDLFALRGEAGAKAAKHGTGPKLTLVDASAKAVRSAQTDTDPTNNFSEMLIEVSGKNGADLEAIGAKLTGKAGAEVTARVGFRNNGPATLDHVRGGSDVTFVDVTLPTGTTAVEVPENCAPFKGDDTDWDTAGKPGASEYRCFPGPFVQAGDDRTGDFRLRIDKVVPNATGTVKINAPCKCEGGFYDDLKPANDIAKILVNATGDNGQGGGEGEDGPSLPVTGSSTGLIAGLGGLLLVAGVGGYLVAKRRKTRFVA